MKDFKVRSKFVPYGAKLILNSTYDIEGIITNCHIKNGKLIHKQKFFNKSFTNWRFAYNLFMSSLLTHVTINNHALECHFKMAGNILASYFKFRNNMPGNLYNFFLPFLYKTQEVNDRAHEILTNKNGIVSRLFAFTKTGLERFYEYTCDNFEYKNPNEMNCVSTPAKSDLIKYWLTFDHFTNKYVKTIQQDIDKWEENSQLTNFINDISLNIKGLVKNDKTPLKQLQYIMTALIFNSSIWHEHIGNVSRYLIRPGIMTPKLYISKSNIFFDTKQNYIQSLFLSSVTSVQSMPRINDNIWKLYQCSAKNHNHSQQQTTTEIEICKIWKDFQQILKSNDFIESIKIPYLLPDNLECSVSL